MYPRNTKGASKYIEDGNGETERQNITQKLMKCIEEITYVLSSYVDNEKKPLKAPVTVH